MFRCTLVVFLLLGIDFGVHAQPARQVQAQPPAKQSRLKFEVRIAADQAGQTPESGRVLVAIGPKNGSPDFTNYRPPVLPVLGADADSFTADKTVTLDANSDVFPAAGFEKLPAGEYTVQAGASCQGGVYQWVRIPPGNWRSSR
jgi:hypothetical protein